MNYLKIYEHALAETGSDIEAAEAVSKAFDAEEQRLADEEAKEAKAE